MTKPVSMIIKMEEAVHQSYKATAFQKGQTLSEWVRRALAAAYSGDITPRITKPNDICDYCAEPGHQDTDRTPCPMKAELIQDATQRAKEGATKPLPPVQDPTQWEDMDCNACLGTKEYPEGKQCPKCKGVGFLRVRK